MLARLSISPQPSFVATFSMEDATAFAACHDYEDRHVIEYLSCIDDEEMVEVAAVAARQVAAAAATGVSLPVCLAESIVSHVQRGWRVGPAGGSVVSASLLNAKPASGGIGVVPRRGDVLRVLFTVTSDAVADTIVRYRCSLRCCWNISTKTNIFDVLTDTQEAQRLALWPAFVAAKAAGKRAQFHRAHLMIDGERVVVELLRRNPPAATLHDVALNLGMLLCGLCARAPGDADEARLMQQQQQHAGDAASADAAPPRRLPCAASRPSPLLWV
ncbi:hypothetical protein FOA52_000349 [Chlamydomonas sp. UWO 241]|nr:hypothetical protein FOA52_000349 [Chlamydomonas sp. UWO 241]